MTTTLARRPSRPLKLSDDDVQDLWERHSERLRTSVRRRMKTLRDKAICECDVVSISFSETVLGIRSGAYPNLQIESGFWPLLLTVAQRRVTKIIEAAATQKRGGDVAVFRQSDLEKQMGDYRSVGIKAHPAKSHGPSLLVELGEILERLLAKLDDDDARQIVLKKLAGVDTQSVAEEMGTTSRKIYRILAAIKPIWERSLLDRYPESY